MSYQSVLSAKVKNELRRLSLDAEQILRKHLNMSSEGFSTSDGKHLPEGTVLIAWFLDTKG